MKQISLFIIGIFIFFSYGLFLNRYSLHVIEDTLLPQNPPGFYDYRGVMNVHSSESTGSRSVAEIITAAKAAGLDFLVFNELNKFDRVSRSPSYSEQLLVSFDNEYSYRNSRVLHLMGAKERSFEDAGQAQLQLADLLNKPSDDSSAGFYVIAHPFKPRFSWAGDVPPGVQGLEVINLKVIWQNAWLEKKASFFWTLFTYLFNERLALMRLFESPEKEIRFWDQQNKLRPVWGFAGSDAESRLRISEGLFLRFPSYETLLNIATNHVLLRAELTGNARDDHKKIQEAFLKGSFYFSLDTLANPKGFNVTIEDPQGKVYPMGSEVRLKPNLELVVRLPQKPKVPFDVILYRNGERAFTSNSLETRWVLHEEGVYRVKVRVIPTFPLPDGKKWIPWIYSNPFFVTTK